MHSWRVLLLPFIDQQALYEEFDLSKPWDSPTNLEAAKQMPTVYAITGEDRPGVTVTNYLAIVGPNTLWPGASARSENEIQDDPASTILIVENLGKDVHWTEPRDLRIDTMSFTINQPNGVSSRYVDPAVVMLDTSLRRLKEDFPKKVFHAMLTVDGGEQIAKAGDSWELLPDGRMREER